MPPPPADNFAARLFLGPALRAQPDRRLVTLVREGYESAFEEIVRRYARPLDRFAAAIVGGGSEDVTQEAFSKAHLALRGSETDIELRPWLYRIVRNTALNDIRDRAPATAELTETIPGSQSAAVEAERREEIGELMGRLRALPEPQRAAIVMRELEGLGHEEIAAALGISGGAARQAIYRARVTLRNGLGMLVPLPLLRALFDHGSEAAAGAGGAVAAVGTASAAAGSTGAALGGLGAGAALKAALAAVLVAGSVGAGVAIQRGSGGNGVPGAAEAAAAGLPGGGQRGAAGPRSGDPEGSGSGRDNSGDRGSGGSGDRSGEGRHGDGGGGSSGDGNGGGGSSGPGGGGSGTPSGHSGEGSSGHDGSGSSHDGGLGEHSGSGDDSGAQHSPGGGSDDGSVSGGSGSGSSGGSGSDGGGSGELSGGSESGSGGGGGGSGSDDPVVTPLPLPEEALPDGSGDSLDEQSGSSGSSSSGSGSSGSSSEIDP